ncbi:hypothetical protein ACFWAP_00545 [Streptomyces goshikiensis]|uniref:hypothetical protein n=1 Tax=Streptomyces goshikiensis TaxID=1942 RepID=UPI00366116D8
MAVYLVSSEPVWATTAADGSDPFSQYSRQITASATSTSGGTAALTPLRPAGGFADFAVNNSVSPDPAMSYIGGSDQPTTSTSWQRMSLTATAPIDYNRGDAGKLWNGAAYASVGLRFDNIPGGGVVAFDRVQFGQAPTGNLLNRAAAFHDEHMCYENGPGALATRTQERSLVGGWSAKVVQQYIPAGGTDTGWGLDPHTDAMAVLQAGGGRVTARVAVSTDVSRRWRVRVRAYDAGYSQVYDGLNDVADNTSLAKGVWSTAQVSVTVPATARYAAVTPYVFWDGTPTVGWYYYSDGHYISYNSTASEFRVPAWEAPRHLNIRVKAKRTNLLNNPGFHAECDGWGVFRPAGAPYPMIWDSSTGRRRAGSAKFVLANTYGGPGRYGIGAAGGLNPETKCGDMLKTGVPHTLSAWVRVPAGYPPVAAGAWDPLAVQYVVGPNSDWIKANRPELVEGDWVRVYCTWTPPATSTRQFYGGVFVDPAAYQVSASGAQFWVDDFLLEEGVELHDAFDGNDISVDYVWQGEANASKSLYFPGRARNADRITQILKDNVPWGTTFDLLFS